MPDAAGFQRRHVLVPTHRGDVAAWLHDAGPDTPAVVVAHGSGFATRDYLTAEAEILAAHGVTVLVADKQMAGYSVWERDYDALAGTMALQAVWLRERGHARVTLLGFSEGTWVASIAGARPGVADALALLSPPIVTVADQTAHEWLMWWPRFVPGRRAVHALFDRVLAALVPAYRRGTDVELAAVEALGIPVIAVWGAKDPLVDVHRAQRLLGRLVPSARQVLVLGTGHGLRRDQPRWLADVAALALG